MNVDLYALLGVRSDATGEEIKNAYRELARTLHPDVNPGPAAAALFKQVTAAYCVLSDPQKRHKFDNPAPPPPRPPKPSPPPRPPRPAQPARPTAARGAPPPQPDLVACERCGKKTDRSLLTLNAVWSGAEQWCLSCNARREQFFNKLKFGIPAAVLVVVIGLLIWFVLGAFHATDLVLPLVIAGVVGLIRLWIKRDEL